MRRASSSQPALCPGTNVSTTSCFCLLLSEAVAIHRVAQPWVINHTPVAMDPSDMMWEPLGKNWRLWRITGHMLLLNTSESSAANGGKFLKSASDTRRRTHKCKHLNKLLSLRDAPTDMRQNAMTRGGDADMVMRLTLPLYIKEYTSLSQP